MIKLYKHLLSKSLKNFFILIICYTASILFALLPAKYQRDIIRDMPLIAVLLIIYPFIISLIILYYGSGYLSSTIKEFEKTWEKFLPGRLFIKSINMIKIFIIRTTFIRVLATLFYPFYLTIVFYNFIYIVLGLKSEKLLKRRILAPVLIFCITSIFSSFFISLSLIFILFYKIKKEKDISIDLSSKDE